MAHTHFDLDVLRSFATGVALGSYAQAANRLGRSTSAVSAQLKKLESQAGTALLRKAGRGLELTEAGHTLLAYAHRLLELNDEAVAAVRASNLQGQVRLGLPQDLGESVLMGVLGRFARAHPQVLVQVSVGSSRTLREQYDAGTLDLALIWHAPLPVGSPDAVLPPDARVLAHWPLCWIGPSAGVAAPAGIDLSSQPWWPLVAGQGMLADGALPVSLPLVLLSGPCPLNDLVVPTLNRHGLPWRHAFTSASLAALWSAVSAGLGLAVRTPLGLPPQVRALAPAEVPGLPTLPTMALVQHGHCRLPQVAQLAGLLAQALQPPSAAAWPL